MRAESIKALELLKQEQEVSPEDYDIQLKQAKKSFENALEEEELATSELQKAVNQGIIEVDEDEIIKLKDVEKVKEKVYGSLEKVYQAYNQYYHIEDFKKIDLLLATILSVDSADKNIWILFVGASGIGKSMLTNPIKYIDYPKDESVAHLVSDITTNTIVSGQGGKDTDLAPKLDGKIMYVPDFSTIVGKRSEDQREIFSQLRNLFDGIAKKETGSHGQTHEYNPDVSFIGNVTPAIHSKNLIHQSMGTRFLYYEIRDFKEKDVMEKIWNGGKKNENEKSKEIAKIIENFIREVELRNTDKIPRSVKDEVEKVSKWTAKMRASGSFDRYKNELESSIEPEKPARILKQFKKIYIHLKKLEEDYPDERALNIIKNIGASSIDPDKRRIYIELDQAESGLEISDLIDRIGIGRKAIKRRLLEMQNVGILETGMDYSPESDTITYDAWKIRDEFQGLSSSLVSS